MFEMVVSIEYVAMLMVSNALIAEKMIPLCWMIVLPCYLMSRNTQSIQLVCVVAAATCSIFSLDLSIVLTEKGAIHTPIIWRLLDRYSLPIQVSFSQKKKAVCSRRSSLLGV